MKTSHPVIKSARVFEKNGLVHVDYRTHPRNGKDIQRFRFSTGLAYSQALAKSLERQAFGLALEHFESKLENKSVILFEDVAGLALKEAEAGRRKDDGTKDYQSILEKSILPFFGSMPLQEVRVKDVKAWIQKMGERHISQNRFNKYYYALKRVFDFAFENEFVERNIMDQIKRSSPLFKKPKSKEDAYYTGTEVETILTDSCEACSETDKERHRWINTFAHVAFLTGMRTGEILALKASDIDFERRTIRVQRSIRRGIISSTKTDTVRTVPMVDRLYEVLVRWREVIAVDWLFPNPRTNRPYTDSRTVSDHRFRPMLKRLEIPYKGMYQTRHTFASLSLIKGVPLPTISKCLGHKNITTTEIYVRLGNLSSNAMKDQLENLSA